MILGYDEYYVGEVFQQKEYEDGNLTSIGYGLKIKGNQKFSLKMSSKVEGLAEIIRKSQGSCSNYSNYKGEDIFFIRGEGSGIFGSFGSSAAAVRKGLDDEDLEKLALELSKNS